MEFPEMIRILQRFDRPKIEKPGDFLSRKLKGIQSQLNISHGQSVAVACGSRGLSDYPELVESMVSFLKAMGLKPFMVPCMGSHGAGTAEGQEDVLKHLGLIPEKIGAPIRSSLDVVKIGEIEGDVPVYVDKLAYEADHIVLINRIKKHTDFVGPIESGLLKLMAIGLGKIKGATTYHQAMISMGASETIRKVAHQVLEKCRVLFGVATIENGFGEVADVGVFTPDLIESGEKAMFAASKTLSPALPFKDVDILHIDEIGKEISGAGFDTRVVGRIRLPGTPEPKEPCVKRLILSDLTPGSEGNAIGMGVADIITRRLADKVDQKALDINTIVSLALEMGKTPLVMPSDKEALKLAMRCVGLTPPSEQKIIRIKNTLKLEEVEVSRAYAREIEERDDLSVIKGPEKIHFDSNGYFKPFFE